MLEPFHLGCMYTLPGNLLGLFTSKRMQVLAAESSAVLFIQEVRGLFYVWSHRDDLSCEMVVRSVVYRRHCKQRGMDKTVLKLLALYIYIYTLSNVYIYIYTLYVYRRSGGSAVDLPIGGDLANHLF